MSRRKKALFLAILIMIAIDMPSESSSQFKGEPLMGEVYGHVFISGGDILEELAKRRIKYAENNLPEIIFSKNGNSRIFKACEISGFWHYSGGKVMDLHTPGSQQNENYESVPSLKIRIPVFIYMLPAVGIKVFQHRSIQGLSSGSH